MTYQTHEQIDFHFDDDEQLSDTAKDNLLKRIEGYQLFIGGEWNGKAGELVGGENRTLDLHPHILELIVNAGMARHVSDRFRSELDGENILDWFNRIMGNQSDEVEVLIDNGTYRTCHPVGQWRRYFEVSVPMWTEDRVVVNGYDKTTKQRERIHQTAL